MSDDRMCSTTHPDHVTRMALDLFLWGEHWDRDRLEDVDPEELAAARRDVKRVREETRPDLRMTE